MEAGPRDYGFINASVLVLKYVEYHVCVRDGAMCIRRSAHSLTLVFEGVLFLDIPTN